MDQHDNAGHAAMIHLTLTEKPTVELIINRSKQVRKVKTQFQFANI